MFEKHLLLFLYHIKPTYKKITFLGQMEWPLANTMANTNIKILKNIFIFVP